MPTPNFVSESEEATKNKLKSNLLTFTRFRCDTFERHRLESSINTKMEAALKLLAFAAISAGSAGKCMQCNLQISQFSRLVFPSNWHWLLIRE